MSNNVFKENVLLKGKIRDFRINSSAYIINILFTYLFHLINKFVLSFCFKILYACVILHLAFIDIHHYSDQKTYYRTGSNTLYTPWFCITIVLEAMKFEDWLIIKKKKNIISVLYYESIVIFGIFDKSLRPRIFFSERKLLIHNAF